MHDQEELRELESDGLLGESKNSLRQGYRFNTPARFLVATSISLNILTLVLGLIRWFHNNHTLQNSYEHGFDSDLGSTKSVVELMKYRFTGGVKLSQNGEFFTENSSTSQQYFGKPTPAIDQAWTNLLTGLNIDLEDWEAGDLNGKTFRWPESGLLFTGIEVFHSLHCLNRIRQAFYPAYYNVFSNPNDPPRDAHLDHCLNHLRQAVQCHADLTPMEWIRVGDKIILHTETLHTCRNFDKIHEWARKRRTHFDKIDSVRNEALFIVD